MGELDTSELQAAIAYSFSDASLLSTALTHKSSGARNNERLEFLGDSLLNLIIADALYTRSEVVPEGVMTTARAKLVKGDTLAKVGSQLKLDELLVLGAGERRSSRKVKASIVGDAVEAIIAAVYLDGGFDVCREVVLKLFSGRLEKVSLQPESKDAKTRLQELMQAGKKALPRYELCFIEGPDHKQQFTVECKISVNSICERGTGSSRRAAEQAAAKNVLAVLENGDNS